MVRLAAVAPGPVFYQVPLYRALADDPRVDLTVYYASAGGVQPYDAGFGGRRIAWDVDLLDGYRSHFLSGADDGDVLKGFFALRGTNVVREVLRGGFDAVWVHGYSYLVLWLAMAAAALSGTAVLMREEQTLLHDRRWPKSWVRSGILRTLFRRTSGLYIGSNNREFFASFGVPTGRLFFVPYCVDNESLRAEARRLTPEREILRRRFGVHEDTPLVLFVGKLIPKKEPLLLLDAYRRVRERRPCALVFVGEGPLEKELRRRSASLPDVHFAGFLNRSEIASAYVAADIFVLPSNLHETWGLVVNEAMNFSLPIITSDKVGCSADLVVDGENGFVFPSGDRDRLAEALDGLVGDAVLCSDFGKRSLRLVERFSYRMAAEGIIHACQQAEKRKEKA